mmetsp:Transcript_129791/g.307953  ORF Transcript_129791/g.307953 Transcript_129791/m.307953 type:complete len:244 (-) Transcript_129791:22-753(-)
MPGPSQRTASKAGDEGSHPGRPGPPGGLGRNPRSFFDFRRTPRTSSHGRRAAPSWNPSAPAPGSRSVWKHVGRVFPRVSPASRHRAQSPASPWSPAGSTLRCSHQARPRPSPEGTAKLAPLRRRWWAATLAPLPAVASTARPGRPVASVCEEGNPRVSGGPFAARCSEKSDCSSSPSNRQTSAASHPLRLSVHPLRWKAAGSRGHRIAEQPEPNRKGCSSGACSSPVLGTADPGEPHRCRQWS